MAEFQMGDGVVWNTEDAAIHLRPTYCPEVFRRSDVEDARDLILMEEVGLTPSERWERETPWLLPYLKFPPGMVIDFGCGIGRLARHVILENPVIGVDISDTMRAHAKTEIPDCGRFTAIDPAMLRELVTFGARASGALAIWALQHVSGGELDAMVALLADALVQNAPLWTLDHAQRYVPLLVNHVARFYHDGLSVPKALEPKFELIEEIAPPTDLCMEGAMLRHWKRR